MIDKNSILNQYLPLQLITFGDVYADKDDDQDAWLNEYDFSWQPIVDSKHRPQLYFGDEVVRFEPEGRNRTECINRRTGGQPLRMPKVSFCWGSKSLLIANDLAEQLQFSDKLGITRSATKVRDAAGHLHSNFSALSFHKALFHQRFEDRFAEIAQEMRPLISIAKGSHQSLLLIHKSVLERWQQLGVEEVNYQIKEEDLKLSNLLTRKHYWPRSHSRSFRNMDDFQQNQNVMIDD